MDISTTDTTQVDNSGEDSIPLDMAGDKPVDTIGQLDTIQEKNEDNPDQPDVLTGPVQNEPTSEQSNKKTPAKPILSEKQQASIDRLTAGKKVDIKLDFGPGLKSRGRELKNTQDHKKKLLEEQKLKEKNAKKSAEDKKAAEALEKEKKRKELLEKSKIQAPTSDPLQKDLATANSANEANNNPVNIIENDEATNLKSEATKSEGVKSELSAAKPVKTSPRKPNKLVEEKSIDPALARKKASEEARNRIIEENRRREAIAEAKRNAEREKKERIEAEKIAAQELKDRQKREAEDAEARRKAEEELKKEAAVQAAREQKAKSQAWAKSIAQEAAEEAKSEKQPKFTSSIAAMMKRKKAAEELEEAEQKAKFEAMEPQEKLRYLLKKAKSKEDAQRIAKQFIIKQKQLEQSEKTPMDAAKKADAMMRKLREAHHQAMLEEQNVLLEEKRKREDQDRLKRGLPQRWGTVKDDSSAKEQSEETSTIAGSVVTLQTLNAPDREKNKINLANLIVARKNQDISVLDFKEESIKEPPTKKKILLQDSDDELITGQGKAETPRNQSRASINSNNWDEIVTKRAERQAEQAKQESEKKKVSIKDKTAYKLHDPATYNTKNLRVKTNLKVFKVQSVTPDPDESDREHPEGELVTGEKSYWKWLKSTSATGRIKALVVAQNWYNEVHERHQKLAAEAEVKKAEAKKEREDRRKKEVKRKELEAKRLEQEKKKLEEEKGKAAEAKRKGIEPLKKETTKLDLATYDSDSEEEKAKTKSTKKKPATTKPAPSKTKNDTPAQVNTKVDEPKEPAAKIDDTDADTSGTKKKKKKKKRLKNVSDTLDYDELLGIEKQKAEEARRAAEEVKSEEQVIGESLEKREAISHISIPEAAVDTPDLLTRPSSRASIGSARTVSPSSPRPPSAHSIPEPRVVTPDSEPPIQKEENAELNPSDPANKSEKSDNFDKKAEKKPEAKKAKKGGSGDKSKNGVENSQAKPEASVPASTKAIKKQLDKKEERNPVQRKSKTESQPKVIAEAKPKGVTGVKTANSGNNNQVKLKAEDPKKRSLAKKKVVATKVDANGTAVKSETETKEKSKEAQPKTSGEFKPVPSSEESQPKSVKPEQSEQAKPAKASSKPAVNNKGRPIESQSKIKTSQNPVLDGQTSILKANPSSPRPPSRKVSFLEGAKNVSFDAVKEKTEAHQTLEPHPTQITDISQSPATENLNQTDEIAVVSLVNKTITTPHTDTEDEDDANVPAHLKFLASKSVDKPNKKAAFSLFDVFNLRQHAPKRKPPPPPLTPDFEDTISLDSVPAADIEIESPCYSYPPTPEPSVASFHIASPDYSPPITPAPSVPSLTEACTPDYERVYTPSPSIGSVEEYLTPPGSAPPTPPPSVGSVEDNLTPPGTPPPTRPPSIGEARAETPDIPRVPTPTQTMMNANTVKKEPESAASMDSQASLLKKPKTIQISRGGKLQSVDIIKLKRMLLEEGEPIPQKAKQPRRKELPPQFNRELNPQPEKPNSISPATRAGAVSHQSHHNPPSITSSHANFGAASSFAKFEPERRVTVQDKVQQLLDEKPNPFAGFLNLDDVEDSSREPTPVPEPTPPPTPDPEKAVSVKAKKVWGKAKVEVPTTIDLKTANDTKKKDNPVGNLKGKATQAKKEGDKKPAGALKSPKPDSKSPTELSKKLKSETEPKAQKSSQPQTIASQQDPRDTIAKKATDNDDSDDDSVDDLAFKPQKSKKKVQIAEPGEEVEQSTQSSTKVPDQLDQLDDFSKEIDSEDEREKEMEKEEAKKEAERNAHSKLIKNIEAFPTKPNIKNATSKIDNKNPERKSKPTIEEESDLQDDQVDSSSSNRKKRRKVKKLKKKLGAQTSDDIDFDLLFPGEKKKEFKSAFASIQEHIEDDGLPRDKTEEIAIPEERRDEKVLTPSFHETTPDVLVEEDDSLKESTTENEITNKEPIDPQPPAPEASTSQTTEQIAAVAIPSDIEVIEEETDIPKFAKEPTDIKPTSKIKLEVKQKDDPFLFKEGSDVEKAWLSARTQNDVLSKPEVEPEPVPDFVEPEIPPPEEEEDDIVETEKPQADTKTKITGPTKKVEINYKKATAVPSKPVVATKAITKPGKPTNDSKRQEKPTLTQRQQANHPPARSTPKRKAKVPESKRFKEIKRKPGTKPETPDIAVIPFGTRYISPADDEKEKAAVKSKEVPEIKKVKKEESPLATTTTKTPAKTKPQRTQPVGTKSDKSTIRSSPKTPRKATTPAPVNTKDKTLAKAAKQSENGKEATSKMPATGTNTSKRMPDTTLREKSILKDPKKPKVAGKQEKKAVQIADDTNKTDNVDGAAAEEQTAEPEPTPAPESPKEKPSGFQKFLNFFRVGKKTEPPKAPEPSKESEAESKDDQEVKDASSTSNEKVEADKSSSRARSRSQSKSPARSKSRERSLSRGRSVVKTPTTKDQRGTKSSSSKERSKSNERSLSKERQSRPPAKSTSNSKSPSRIKDRSQPTPKPAVSASQTKPVAKTEKITPNKTIASTAKTLTKPVRESSTLSNKATKPLNQTKSLTKPESSATKDAPATQEPVKPSSGKSRFPPIESASREGSAQSTRSNASQVEPLPPIEDRPMSPEKDMNRPRVADETERSTSLPSIHSIDSNDSGIDVDKKPERKSPNMSPISEESQRFISPDKVSHQLPRTKPTRREFVSYGGVHHVSTNEEIMNRFLEEVKQELEVPVVAPEGKPAPIRSIAGDAPSNKTEDYSVLRLAPHKRILGGGNTVLPSMGTAPVPSGFEPINFPRANAQARITRNNSLPRFEFKSLMEQPELLPYSPRMALSTDDTYIPKIPKIDVETSRRRKKIAWSDEFGGPPAADSPMNDKNPLLSDESDTEDTPRSVYSIGNSPRADLNKYVTGIQRSMDNSMRNIIQTFNDSNQRKELARKTLAKAVHKRVNPSSKKFHQKHTVI